MNQSFIYLASSSPRRRELLGQLGVQFRVHAVEIDESRRRGEDADALVSRLAREKAAAAVAELGGETPVLAADTVVVIDGEALGKPAGRADALAMLQRLSGRAHHVLTAVTAVARGEAYPALNRTEVRFRMITPAEAEAYWETGEPADKAGAYAIQGRGAVFIEHIAGSYSGVMGLPLYETAQLLQRAGVGVTGVEA